VKTILPFRHAALVVAFGALALMPSAAAAQATGGATLRLIVKDQTGAVVPGAMVQVRGAEAATEALAREDLPSDGQGMVVVEGLRPGRYVVQVDFPGFETLVMPDVRLRNGENRRDAVLAVPKYDESVMVGRDPATAASDPQNERFDTVLSKSQIDALPDDPDEMERVLQQMAGPGATIRVDGFRGGRLPPKSQIRSIRFSRDRFAAEHHGGGMGFVDIVTQPGLGPLRGSMDFNFRSSALNARNAYAPEKGPEQSQQYTFNLNGTLWKERTSFAISANAASLYDSANVFAVTPDGSRQTPIRRPSDRQNFNGRLDHALTGAHTLRVNLQQNASDQRNLGVGTFDLPERAFQRSSTDRVLRLSENGPWGRALFGETRLQVRWRSTDSASAVDAPTIRVLDAFTAGGAQQAGGRRSTELEWATNVDWAKGRHSVRAGLLVEGGFYNSDTRTNDLGTWTFTSLADYEAGRPAIYTRRIGDPHVTYSQWEFGFFVQDDWRLRQNLSLSAGLRKEFQTNLGDKLNLAPRVGLTWSPFAHGRTTVRAGGGIFYDWLESNTYEQVLRVDGQRQQELVVRNPGWPDPLSGGLLQVPAASKYVMADNLVMPRRVMATAGISQQISPRLGSNLSFTRTEGSNRLRGRLLNTPGPDGRRPDPTVGNITQVESTASSRGSSFNGGINFMIPERRTFLFANYTYSKQENDADGPFSLPADSRNLSGEWGPAAGMPRHIFNAMVNTTLPLSLRLGLNVSARSGSPYNITTGRDDNGDTVFNDRPAGVSRNSARGDGSWDLGGRLSYSFGFGSRGSGDGGGPVMGQPIVVRGGNIGDALGALGGGGAESKRIRFEVFVSASNLLNTVNRIGYSGVMTSPFFGQATGALPGRRIDLGARIGF
jgi:hypothetical protein